MATRDSNKTTIQARLILATAMTMIALSGGACAQEGANALDLKVVDRDTGRELRVWRHHGRLFVAGQPGARYSLRVANHTDGRVLVVLSVDGVNILSGETANYDQRGYVFNPYQAYDVTGWRKSNSEVAAFTFAPLPQSYAARTGRPGNVGVIGMAVFKEQASVSPQDSEVSATEGGWKDRSSDAARPSTLSRAAPAQKSAPAAPFANDRREAASGALALREEKLGTAHGAREWSAAQNVTFERASSYPQYRLQIEYDSYANLVASGVIPPRVYRQPHPRPFPAGPDGEGYVADPPG